MSINSLQQVLDFLKIRRGYFEITAQNDVLKLDSSESGSAEDIDVADGTYSGAGLATALATAMNANSTLTGGSITFAVTYSSSTYKFTLDATSGETIDYTHAGSDGGSTFGFTADTTAAQTITSDIPAADPTTIVQRILDGADQYIKEYCGKDFESADFSERYNGTGNRRLFLNQYPVTGMTRVSLGTQGAMQVRNTNAQTTASVQVSSTGLTLTLDGTADSTDVTFASNVTVTAIVTAINAIGSGWAAEAVSSFGSYKSSDLLERFGASCINSNWVELYVPDEAEDELELDASRGILNAHSKFPVGLNNVLVEYTAGYSAANMPNDLKLAHNIICQHFYRRWQEESFGVQSFSVGGIQSTAEGLPIPKEALTILNKYKKLKV